MGGVRLNKLWGLGFLLLGLGFRVGVLWGALLKVSCAVSFWVPGSFCKTAPQNYLGFYGYVLGEGLWGGYAWFSDFG